MCFRPPAVVKPKTCPECGAMNSGTMSKCSKCGAELPEEEKQKVECPRCGALMDEDAVVCAICGLSKLEAERQAAEHQICPKCNARNKGLADHCFKCKEPLYPFGEEWAAKREENLKKNQAAAGSIPVAPVMPAAPKAPGAPPVSGGPKA